MAYSAQVVLAVKKAPKTLGNQLGRWAVHHNFSAIRVAKVTGATRQSVYNWFHGGEVFVAYRTPVQSLIKILQSSGSADDAWRKACRMYDLA